MFQIVIHNVGYEGTFRHVNQNCIGNGNQSAKFQQWRISLFDVDAMFFDVWRWKRTMIGGRNPLPLAHPSIKTSILTLLTPYEVLTLKGFFLVNQENYFMKAGLNFSFVVMYGASILGKKRVTLIKLKETL